MKRIISAIITLSIVFNAFAQDYELSSSRKNVKTSTDVIAVAMPVATLACVLINKDWQGLKQGAFTAATTIGATMILKYSIRKKRPDGSDYHSFPSFHTSAMFADAAFIQRRYGWKWGVPAYMLSAYVGWGRTYAKKHDWWDVAAGAVIGAGSAYIFTRPFAKEHNVVVAPVATNDRFGFVAAFDF
jgi:membrane-associated phospholipid phosphatase